MLEDPVWFDPSYYRSGFFNTDVTITGLATNTNFNIKLPAGTGSNFNIQDISGNNLLQVNQVSGGWIFSKVNHIIAADTIDGADNKFLYLCGGGGNSVGRGARVILAGNEGSGAAGVAYIYSGDASSAFVDINAATAVSGSIRFKINSVDQWRMAASSLVGYDTTVNNIARINDTGQLVLLGGSAVSPANSSYIRLYGNAHATDPGVIQFLSGSNAAAYIRYNALATGAVGYHRFDIDSIERWRMSGDNLIGMSTTASYILRNNTTGFLVLCGGTSTSTAAGSTIQINGVTGGATVGAISLTTSNVSTAHIVHLVSNASAKHRFYIGGVEHLAFQDNVLFLCGKSITTIYRGWFSIVRCKLPSSNS